MKVNISLKIKMKHFFLYIFHTISLITFFDFSLMSCYSMNGDENEFI